MLATRTGWSAVWLPMHAGVRITLTRPVRALENTLGPATGTVSKNKAPPRVSYVGKGALHECAKTRYGASSGAESDL